MVIRIEPGYGFIAVRNGDKFSGQWSVDIASDDPSGLGQCLQTVESVVGFGDTGTVGIGLLKFQPRSHVVEPRGGVSVSTARRIIRNIPFIHPESSQRHHVIGFVVGETGRLDRGAILGYLSAADVVGIAGSASQAVGDGSHGIAAGKVAGGGHGAGCVRDLDSTSCKIRFLNSSVAAAVGFFQNHACGDIEALL